MIEIQDHGPLIETVEIRIARSSIESTHERDHFLVVMMNRNHPYLQLLHQTLKNLNHQDWERKSMYLV